MGQENDNAFRGDLGVALKAAAGFTIGILGAKHLVSGDLAGFTERRRGLFRAVLDLPAFESSLRLCQYELMHCCVTSLCHSL